MILFVETNTLLLRQVHPTQWNGERVVSVAFLPKESDQGLLSVYDGEQISPEASHRHYTETSGLKSMGVWAVTVAEADAAALPSRLDAEGHYPEHAVIDFTAHPTKKARETRAKVLAAKANARQSLYLAPDTPPVDGTAST